MMTFSCDRISISNGSRLPYSTHLFPGRIGIEFVRNPVSQRGCQNIHEGCSRRNNIAVPSFLDDIFHTGRRRTITILLGEHLLELLFLLISFFGFLRRSESTRALLVHFGARRNSICVTRICVRTKNFRARMSDREDYIPTAIIKSFLGRTMFTTRSVYLKISSIISSSFSGGGLPSGWVHG